MPEEKKEVTAAVDNDFDDMNGDPIYNIEVVTQATIIKKVAEEIKGMRFKAAQLLDEYEAGEIHKKIMSRLGQEYMDGISNMTYSITINAGVRANDKTREKKAEDRAKSLLSSCKKMPTDIIAQLLVQTDFVRVVKAGDLDDGATDDKILAYRVFEGGVPTVWGLVNSKDADELEGVISNLDCTLDKADRKKVVTHCLSIGRVVRETYDPYLLFLGNGVLDGREASWDETTETFNAVFTPYDNPTYEVKYGHDFTPVGKNSIIDWEEQTQPVYVHNDEDECPEPWEVISGLKVLFPDDDWWSMKLLLKIAQGCVMKTNFGYSWVWVNGAVSASGGVAGKRTGRNGKSMCGKLFSNLIGVMNVMSKSIYDIGTEPFPLMELPKCGAIISHEMKGSDKRQFDIDKYKQLCMQCKDGPITIARKGMADLRYIFHGQMIQMTNSLSFMPTDDSGSTFRRFQFFPWNKTIPEEEERPQIKEAYINDEAVLKYFLWYILRKQSWEQHYDKEALEMIKSQKTEVIDDNNSVHQFLNEMLLPYTDETVDKNWRDGEPWVCPKCGRQVEASNRFCGDCGTEKPDKHVTNLVQMCPWTAVQYKMMFAFYLEWAKEQNIRYTVMLKSFKEDCMTWTSVHPEWTVTEKMITPNVRHGYKKYCAMLADYGKNTVYGMGHATSKDNADWQEHPGILCESDMKQARGGLILTALA